MFFKKSMLMNEMNYKNPINKIPTYYFQPDFISYAVNKIEAITVYRTKTELYIAILYIGKEILKNENKHFLRETEKIQYFFEDDQTLPGHPL